VDATPEAAASLACLRFELGVPHYLLADAQAACGMPLAAPTQQQMMEPLRHQAEAVFHALEKVASKASGRPAIIDHFLDQHLAAIEQVSDGLVLRVLLGERQEALECAADGALVQEVHARLEGCA